MTLPRCRCGRKAISIAPGTAPTYAPGHFLAERGKRSEAWCKRCAEARGWLAAPEGPTIAAACSAPRSARRTPATGKGK